MRLKQMVTITVMLTAGMTAMSQQALTLEECRRRALESNRSLMQAEARRDETEALKQVALWQMLPKVSANGGYVWMDNSVELLSGEQKQDLQHMGDNVNADISALLHEQLGNVPLVGDALADRLGNVFANSGIGDRVNTIGDDLVQALETDTRNMGFGMVTVTQPIYMGGKLRSAYRTARLMDDLNGIKYDEERESTLVEVDEAYWQVVSVQHKQKLAEQYAALLDTLEHNVEMAVEAEVATKGDLAKVRTRPRILMITNDPDHAKVVININVE